MKLYCVFSLESPHRGDSGEYTKYTIFSIKQKFILYYPKYAAMGFSSQGTPERVRNCSGKRGIRVRATVVLLYLHVAAYLPFIVIFRLVEVEEFFATPDPDMGWIGIPDIKAHTADVGHCTVSAEIVDYVRYA